MPPCIITPTSKPILPIYAHSEEIATKSMHCAGPQSKTTKTSEFKHEKIVEMYFSFLHSVHMVRSPVTRLFFRLAQIV